MGSNPLGEKYIFEYYFTYIQYIYLTFNQNIKFSSVVISIFYFNMRKCFVSHICLVHTLKINKVFDIHQ